MFLCLSTYLLVGLSEIGVGGDVFLQVVEFRGAGIVRSQPNNRDNEYVTTKEARALTAVL